MDQHERLAALQTYFPNACAHPETDAGAADRNAPQAHAPAARPRPRLDLWTHSRPTEPHVELVVNDCGNGNVEATAIVRGDQYRPTKPRKKRKDPELTKRETMSEDDLMRCGRRARKRVRQSCKVLGADRLLTLTSRRYLYTPDRLWRAFAEFRRLMVKRFDHFRYVAVPELHPKHEDHYHMHLAIRGYYNVDTVRFLWRQALRNTCKDAALDHTPGNIDIAYKPNNYAVINRVARYISKYISKSYSAGFKHRKRYDKSRGLDPEKTVIFAPLGVTDLDIIRKVQALSGGILARNPRWDVYGGYDCLMVETEAGPDAKRRGSPGRSAA